MSTVPADTLMRSWICVGVFFFFNDTATTEIYTLSLHDALPIFAAPLTSISPRRRGPCPSPRKRSPYAESTHAGEVARPEIGRAPSELQSQSNLVCRLLLEKKNSRTTPPPPWPSGPGPRPTGMPH